MISRTEEAAKKGGKRRGIEWKDSIQDSIVTRCREYRFDVGCSDDFLDGRKKAEKTLFHGVWRDRRRQLEGGEKRGGAALFGFVVTRRSFETRLFQRVDSHTFTVSPVTRDKKSTGLRFSERWEKSKRMQRERNGNAILPFWMKLYFLDRWLVNGPILDSRLLISF